MGDNDGSQLKFDGSNDMLLRFGPASGGSRITLDGTEADLTFNSGSSAVEVIKLQEKNSFTLFDATTASNVTTTGPELLFKNGGAVRASGSHALGAQQVFGFNSERAFFQGGRNGAVLDVRNVHNAGFARGAYISAFANGGGTGAVGLNVDGKADTSGDSATAVSAIAIQTNSGNSTGDVIAVRGTSQVHLSQTNDDVFGVKGNIIDTAGLGATYTSRGSAVQGVGGKYAIHGKSAGTYQGYFEGIVAATNDVIAFQSSDKRLKTNIQKIDKPLEKILKLNGVSFEWKRDIDEKVENKTNIGVIAQEVEKVLPEIVKKRDNDYLAIKYEQLVPVLIEGIKEQQEQIDELKKKLEDL